MTYLRLELSTQLERKKKKKKKNGWLMMQERLGTFDQNATGGDNSQEGTQNISRIYFLETPSSSESRWKERRISGWIDVHTL